MKNLFLDTNIIIDVIGDRKPFSESAARLFHLGEKGTINLFISALSYANIYYVLRKDYSHKEMIAILKDLEAIFKTLDVTEQVISKALHSDFKDFEDSIQYNSALANKRIGAIVTRNGKDYKKSEIAILTPEEALRIIESAGS